MSRALKIVVTGGSGRVGRSIVSLLMERGHRVTNIDRQPTTLAGGRFAPFVFADVGSRPQIQPLLEGADAVIHLADVPNSNLLPVASEITQRNLATAGAVISSAADTNCPRVVAASTCQVYGSWGPQPLPPVRFLVDEQHPLRPRCGYALSKVFIEQFAAFTVESSKTAVMCMRFPAVLNDDALRGSVRRMFASVQGVAAGQGSTIGQAPLHEFGTYIHTSDCAAAFVAAAEGESWGGFHAVNLAAADAMAPQPLRGHFARHSPEYPPLPDGHGDYESVIDCTKATALLGWRPVRSWRDFV